MIVENSEMFIHLDNLWKQFHEGSQVRQVLRGTGAAFKRGEFMPFSAKAAAV